MVRKLSLAIALALGVTPFAVNSLGLGDIKTKSGLNQQFQADIELLSVKDEEIADIRVSLAPDDVFAKAGVNRPYFLSQLKFQPIRLPNGKGVIRVTSGEPVREPFLNFLIELNWPKGRLYREFTVLLDPPATLQRRPPPVQTATTSGKAKPAQPASPSTAGRSTGSSGEGASEYGPTRRNDTLWKIAAEVQYSGTSMEQMVMAIFQANPQAFIKRNVNNLKVGEILRVPERETVLAMTASEARIAFRDQLENWRSDSEPAEVSPAQETAAADTEQAGAAAVKEPAADGMDESAMPEAELKIASTITAEETEKSAADGIEQKASSTSLKDDLIDAREMRESALEESRELKSRVENLSSQLEDLQRLLELKDEQLAKLQIALGEKPDKPVTEVVAEPIPMPDAAVIPATLEGAGESSSEPGVASEETAAPNLESVDDEKIEIEISQPESMAQEDGSAAGAGDEASAGASEMAEKTEMAPAPAETESLPESEPKIAATEEKIEIKPSPVAEPAPVQKAEAGFVEKLTSHPLLKKLTGNPIVMAIGGGVVIVLLGVIWLASSRRRKESEEFQESILTDTIGEKDESAVIGRDESTESESRNTEETSFLSDFSPSDIDELPDDTGEVDPMAEADVYIAYGRYKQAEELVRQGLERDPQNQELKLKLLEILYATKNVAAFSELAQSMKADGLPDSDPGAWQSVVARGAKLVPDNGLFTTKTDATTTQETAPRDELHDLNDLDLDDLAAGMELSDGLKDGSAKAEQEAQPPAGSDDDGMKLSMPEAESNTTLDMDNLGDELASLDASLNMDELEGDGLDLDKIAKDMVSPDEAENVALDALSLDLDSDSGAMHETGLSAEGSESLDLRTEEAERLELPDDSLGGPVADVAYSSDEIDTKLDLARAYLDVGDEEGARSILQEVANEGSEQQKQAAQEIISSFS